VRIVSREVGKALASLDGVFDWVFLDPPYQGGSLDRALRLLGTSRLLAGIAVAEHDVKNPPAERYGRLTLSSRRHGYAADFAGYPLHLEALLVPALRLARDPERGGKNFLRLLGRAYADPAPFIRQFLSEQYAVMIARFKDAFGRALPHLPRKELSWRLHFIMGALSYTLAGTDAHKIISELSPRETNNDEILLRRLAPFLLAGLNAPLPDLTEVTREVDNALARKR